MSARSIARELAIICFPQLAKNKLKNAPSELYDLVEKAVRMLCDYARESLSEANALMLKSAESLAEIEIEHPDNADKTADKICGAHIYFLQKTGSKKNVRNSYNVFFRKKVQWAPKNLMKSRKFNSGV